MNKNDRFNRVQIEWAEVLNSYEYVILDYVLFKSNLTEANNGNGWEFHIRQIAEKISVSKDTISRTFKKWTFIKKIGEGQFSKFIFNYNDCINYMNDLVSNRYTLVSPRDTLVSPRDTLVSMGDKVVSPSVHISKKEVIEEVRKEIIEKVVEKEKVEVIEKIDTVSKYKTKGYVWIREEILKDNSVLSNKEKLELGYYYRLNFWGSLTSSFIKNAIDEKIEQLELEEN